LSAAASDLMQFSAYRVTPPAEPGCAEREISHRGSQSRFISQKRTRSVSGDQDIERAIFIAAIVNRKDFIGSLPRTFNCHAELKHDARTCRVSVKQLKQIIAVNAIAAMAIAQTTVRQMDERPPAMRPGMEAVDGFSRGNDFIEQAQLPQNELARWLQQ